MDGCGGDRARRENANNRKARRPASPCSLAHLMLAVGLGVAAEPCLPQGIIEQNRSYTLCGLPLAGVTSLTSVAEILVSEVLGYHVVRDPLGMIFWGNEGIFHLAGCTDVDCTAGHLALPVGALLQGVREKDRPRIGSQGPAPWARRRTDLRHGSRVVELCGVGDAFGALHQLRPEVPQAAGVLRYGV